MIIEIKFNCAGAAALLAQACGAKPQGVFVKECSVILYLDENLVEHRLLAEQCEWQQLLVKHME